MHLALCYCEIRFRSIYALLVLPMKMGRRGQLKSMSLSQPFTYSILSNGREALPSHGSVQMSGIYTGRYR